MLKVGPKFFQSWLLVWSGLNTSYIFSAILGCTPKHHFYFNYVSSTWKAQIFISIQIYELFRLLGRIFIHPYRTMFPIHILNPRSFQQNFAPSS
jgi:hypothetical protein